MFRIATAMRIVLVAVFMLLPAQILAQEAPPKGEDPAVLEWQGAITSQIEAFRRGDGPAALSLAGNMFQESYLDPAHFMSDIARIGYQPIFDSVSHSFGVYRREGGNMVQQLVKLTGPDHRLYEAVYAMVAEPDGWRVHGVMLRQTPGIAI